MDQGEVTDLVACRCPPHLALWRCMSTASGFVLFAGIGEKMKQRPIDYAGKVFGDMNGLYLSVADAHVSGLRKHLDCRNIPYIAQPSELGNTKLDFDQTVGVTELRVALLRYADMSSQ
jgi:hypothetical protein